MSQVHIKNPNTPANACIIWMHGLGSNAFDMMGLADALPSTPALRHVFLDAPIRPVTLNNRLPMQAWYDIHGVSLTDREDQEGILASEQLILAALKTQQLDFATDKIFLAGFSQGAAMALLTGLRFHFPLAGVIVLSGYLPLASKLVPVAAKDTPIFIASGDFDPIVLPAWTGMSVSYLEKAGYRQVTCARYPMEHTVCAEEIRDIHQWMIHVMNKGEN